MSPTSSSASVARVIPSGDVFIAPSILSADFGNLAVAVASVESETPWLHIDVMDGHFVPNLTIGPPVVRSLRRHSSMFFDCHLMMTNPERYFEAFQGAGADLCSIHVEIGNTASHLAAMRDLGLHVGLVLNPDTPISAVEPFLEDIDLLLVMSVFPGFGGQRFISDTLDKIAEAREVITARGLSTILEVDGGIDLETAPRAARCGARVFVAGNAVFGSEDPKTAVASLYEVATSACLSP